MNTLEYRQYTVLCSLERKTEDIAETVPGTMRETAVCYFVLFVKVNVYVRMLAYCRR